MVGLDKKTLQRNSKERLEGYTSSLLSLTILQYLQLKLIHLCNYVFPNGGGNLESEKKICSYYEVLPPAGICFEIKVSVIEGIFHSTVSREKKGTNWEGLKNNVYDYLPYESECDKAPLDAFL